MNVANGWIEAIRVARERKSSVLASNAVHHRIDSLTSVVALFTIGGAHVFTDASWLDPVGGLLISLMVIQAGYGNTRTSLLELADVTVDNEVKKSIRRAVEKAIKGDAAKGEDAITGAAEISVRDIQGLKSGQNYLIDVELAVPESWSIGQARPIEDAVRNRIGNKVRGVKRVKVRFTPVSSNIHDFSDEFIGADVSPRSSPEPEDEDHHRELKENHSQKVNGKKIR